MTTRDQGNFTVFGQTTSSEVKRDLLILVTPHILDEGEAAPIPGPSR